MTSTFIDSVVLLALLACLSFAAIILGSAYNKRKLAAWLAASAAGDDARRKTFAEARQAEQQRLGIWKQLEEEHDHAG